MNDVNDLRKRGYIAGYVLIGVIHHILTDVNKCGPQRILRKHINTSYKGR